MVEPFTDKSRSFGRLTTVDRDITARCLVIMNRADPALLDYMRYHLQRISPQQGENYKLAKEFGAQLLQNCEEALGTNPLYKDGALSLPCLVQRFIAHLLLLLVTLPTAPQTTITANGDIVYAEVARAKITRLEKYVAEMAAGAKVSNNINVRLLR